MSSNDTSDEPSGDAALPPGSLPNLSSGHRATKSAVLRPTRRHQFRREDVDDKRQTCTAERKLPLGQNGATNAG
jgi:hypothetical protein